MGTNALICELKYIKKVRNTQTSISINHGTGLRKTKFFPGDIVKDIPTENTPSNNIQALMESMNTDIWVIGTLNQLMRSSYTQIN